MLPVPAPACWCAPTIWWRRISPTESSFGYLPEYPFPDNNLHAVCPGYRASSPKLRSLLQSSHHGTRRTASSNDPGPTPGPACYSIGCAEFHAGKAAGGRVAGVDEVGRGPLAGPVVAAAVVFPDRCAAQACRPARRLEETDRRAAPGRVPGPARLGPRRNRRRRRLGRRDRAAEHPARRVAGDVPRCGPAARPARPRAGRRQPAAGAGCPCIAWSAATGSRLSIAAASIVAKVLRDRAMARLAVRFPGYGWDTNAGYATDVPPSGRCAAGTDPAPPAELRHREPAAPGV